MQREKKWFSSAKLLHIYKVFHILDFVQFLQQLHDAGSFINYLKCERADSEVNYWVGQKVPSVFK